MPDARIDAEKETFCSATRNKAGRARERASAATSTQHSGAAERTPTDRRERKRTMAAAHLRLVCCCSKDPKPLQSATGRGRCDPVGR